MGLFPVKAGVGAKPPVPGAAKLGAPKPAAAPPPPAQLSPEEEHARMAAAAFAAIEDVKGSAEQSPRDKPGAYMSRLDKIILKKSEKKETRGQFVVIFEKTILFVTRDDPKGSNFVGEKTGQVFMLAKEAAYSAFRTAVAKILDIPVAAVDKDAATYVSRPDQPLAGTIVLHNNIFGNKPLANGEYFLNCNYERAVSATELLANYAEADEDQKQAMLEHKERFFPDGMLERMAEIEKQQREAAEAEQEPQES